MAFRPRIALTLPALTVALLAVAPAAQARVDQTRVSTTEQRVQAGELQRIYDPSVGETSPWYVNDHTFIRAAGKWHLFGITHAEPAAPLDEDFFAHATAGRLTQGQWTKQAPVLPVDASQGEEHVWAPHVIRHDGTYYMFYSGGDADHTRYRMQLATSRDLKTWTRYAGNPLFQDGFDARDPYVTRIGGRWVMYYTANSEPAGGRHIVAYRTSRDLRHWGPRRTAYTDPRSGTFGGPTESPFVQRHGRYWYMSICCTSGYRDTRVIRSTDPLHFDKRDQVGRIDAHAAEIVRDERGRWFASHAGWGQGGVWLAPLRWNVPTRVTRVKVRTPGYRLTVQTRPQAAITSYRVRGRDGRWRELLSNAARGTGPYIGEGSFGDTDRAGAAATVNSSADGRRLALGDIPLGDSGATVDWSFDFRRRSFDTSFDWDFGSEPADAWEAGWNLETVFGSLGDEGGLQRSGDAPGLPDWAIAYGRSTTLGAGYRAGSAWAADNHFFNPPDGNVAFQPHWQDGGRALPAGRRPGGTWRIGASTRGADTDLGQRLHEGVSNP